MEISVSETSLPWVIGKELLKRIICPPVFTNLKRQKMLDRLFNTLLRKESLECFANDVSGKERALERGFSFHRPSISFQPLASRPPLFNRRHNLRDRFGARFGAEIAFAVDAHAYRIGFHVAF